MTIYRLYVKTHNQTGLKYLGQTTKENPHEYTGSGTRWINHLKKHGYDYTTEILFETNSKEELSEKGLFYSELWDVVNDSNWANLKLETGSGGVMSKESLERMKAKNTGRKHSEETKEKIGKAHKGKIISPEVKAKIGAANKGKPGSMLGKKLSESAKSKISSTHKGIPKGPMSEEHKAAVSAAKKGCVPWNKGKSSSRKGIPLSPETKAKISAALKGKPKR